MKKLYFIFFFAFVSLFAAAQTMTVNTNDGKQVVFNLSEIQDVVFSDETPDIPQTPPRIGDFLFDDGTWSTYQKEGATPIAIVFYVGEATVYGDRTSFYTLKDGITPMEEIHGYAVALNDATMVDGEKTTVWWSAWVNNDEGAGCSTGTEDFLWYTNTKSIAASAEAKGGLSPADDNYPAAYYASIAYEAVCPAPENTSGWFLPSAYQFKYIYDRAYFDEDNSGRACVANSFAALGSDNAVPLLTDDAEFWTSTEYVDSYGYSNWAYYFNFDARSINPGFIANYRKNSGMRVRPVIVF